jgi:hypothetical protein
MSAPETEVIPGVRTLLKFGSQWPITGVDTSNDTFTVDISGRRNDISALLDGSQPVVAQRNSAGRTTHTVASGGATDNGDGTADVPVDAISDSDTDGTLYYRPVVGGQTEANLSLTAGLLDILVKSADVWGEQLNGRRQWDLEANTVFEEETGDWKVGANGNVRLEITYDGTTIKIPELDDLSATFSTDFNNAAGLEDPLWRFQRPTGLSAEIQTTGSYLDPNSTIGDPYRKLLDAQEAGDGVDFTLYFGANLQISGTVAVGDWTASFPSAGDKATFEFTLPNKGAVSFTGAIDEGLGLVLESWVNRWKASALLEYQDESNNRVSGATAWRGESWISEVSLEASTGEELTTSISQAGDGALEDFVQA